MKDDLANSIRVFLEDRGIDPFYFVTLLAIIILASYQNQIKNWDEQLYWQKGLIISTGFAALVFSIMSILRLIGVMNF